MHPAARSSVTLRITQEPGSPHRLRVAGRLRAAGVPELLRACEGEPRATQLELSELQSADDAGLRALESLAAAGLKLLGANPYLALLLGRAGRNPQEPTG